MRYGSRVRVIDKETKDSVRSLTTQTVRARNLYVTDPGSQTKPPKQGCDQWGAGCTDTYSAYVLEHHHTPLYVRTCM